MTYPKQISIHQMTYSLRWSVLLNSHRCSRGFPTILLALIDFFLPPLLYLAFFQFPHFCGRGAGLLLEYFVFLVQDPNFDAEVPPPIGDHQGLCAEVNRILWGIFQFFEMEDPFQHFVGHSRFSGWVVVYPSSILVDVGDIFSEGSHR